MANDKSSNSKVSKSATSPTDACAQSSKTTPKRTQRQRNPVVLLQHDYYQMYDDKNNRSRKRTKASSSSPTPTPTKGSKNPKKRKNTASSSENKKKSSKNSSVISKSIFRWVGPPIIPRPPSKVETTDNKVDSKDQSKSKNKYYQQVEINVGDHPALVGIGDSVLISSADYEEGALHDKINGKMTSIANTTSRAAALNDAMTNDDSDDDQDEILNSTLMSEQKMEVAMNSLDPYIGRVEEMWEEPKESKNDDSEESRFSRMKFRVRWYFKRNDVLPLKGQFTSVSRQQLASSITPRDILLGEQSDINEVSTILGKCRVRRLKPVAEDASNVSSSKNDQGANGAVSSLQKLKGAFFCRYNITIEPPSKSSGKGKIIITPYEGPDEEDEVEEEDFLSTKRTRTESSVSQGSNMEQEGGTTGSEIDSTESIDNIPKSVEVADDDDSSLSITDRRSRKQPSITEGNATLKIKVGLEHQATIPPQINKRKYTPKRNSPSAVWQPQMITDVKLNAYFKDAENILREYMKKKGMDMTRSLPHNVPSVFSASDSTARTSSHCAYREFNVDDLMFLLHDHNYNTTTALRGLKNYPEDYLFIWTREDKALYNVGFQKHASNLHNISKNIKETKNHKDVVDYHYRFKIPDQFKRFQDLKREQSRRMLEAGERLRLNEYLSEGGHHGNGAINGMKKSQQWSRTGGGGPDETGEVEARRLECKRFLFEVREVIGESQYLTLVSILKSLNAKVLTIPKMKEGFTSILKNHPNLLSQFESYLPPAFRN